MIPTALPTAAELAARTASHPAKAGAEPWAVTALVLGDGADGPALLVIRRTTRRGDRWSGHMALPGGKRDPGEEPVATAVRETFEEVAVVLGDPVGRLDDQTGRSSGFSIATFVFAADGLPQPVPEPLEVEEALWVPLHRLLDRANAGVHRWGGILPAPAWLIDGATIWGLTHRIVTSFLEVAHLV